jgi:tetratricopeptide (TPR) repeat protein
MRSRRAIGAIIIAAAMLLLSGAEAPSSASPAGSAAILVAQGKTQEADGNELTALKRYADAVTLDPTLEEGWLAYGALRAKRGELAEAELVYGEGIVRVPDSVRLVLARAEVRRKTGKFDLAAEDVRRALAASPPGAPHEEAAVRGLLTLKRAQGEPAAELAGWRRLLALARAKGDATTTKEATIQVRALRIFVGEIDPALGGRADPDAARRALASIARRQ